MTITALSTQPNSVTRPTTFNTDSDTYHSELPTMITQINAAIASMNLVASGGALSMPYTFSTTTTDADPGAHFLRLGNATQDTSTAIRLSVTDAQDSDRTNQIALFDDSTSTNKGYILLMDATDATKFICFSVSALSSLGSPPLAYYNITVAKVQSSAASPFANNASLLLAFVRTGDAGSAGTIPTAAAGGTVDAITATFSPAITLTDQQMCFVVLAGANATTTPTFAPDGLTAHTITKKGGTALAVGDLPGALAVALLVYNIANTRWELLNPAIANVGNHEVVVTTGNGFGSTNTAIRRFTTTQTNVGTAITYADSAANGASFTIAEAGLFAITYYDAYGAATNNYYGISLNSNQLTTAIQSITTTNQMAIKRADVVDDPINECAVVLSLAVNDVIRAHGAVGETGSTNVNATKFRIRKVGVV